MLLKNCNIVFLDKIEKGSLLIENDIIKEVNAKAFVSAILIVIMIGIIYLLISLMSKLVDWIVSLF